MLLSPLARSGKARQLSFTLPYWLATPVVWISTTCLLAGCALPPAAPEPQAAPALAPLGTQLMQVDAADSAGQLDQAVLLAQKASADYPGEKIIWLRLAQLRYKQARYGEAVVAAQEALWRDPTDRIASSIVAISGLRLASRAVADLRTQNALNGPVKLEAQEQLRSLQDGLGVSFQPITPAEPAVSPATRSRTRRR